jgi:anti-sigma regulatory factor (Ser/Thr protein kinase)
MMKHNKVELTVKAVLSNITDVANLINGEFEKLGLAFQPDIYTAVEEIFVNIVNYAYPTNKEGDVTISMSLDMKSGDSGEAVIRFEDYGKPYNPLQKEDPNLEIRAEERELGGLGIYFVKNLMDRVEYELINGKNVLTIAKVLVKG